MATIKKVDLHLRVDPKLKDFLIQQSQKNSKTLNSFCTDVLGNSNLIKATVLKANSEKASVKLFASMSHNINQLARMCNVTKNAATEEQLQAILEEALLMKQEITAEIKKKGVVIYGNL